MNTVRDLLASAIRQVRRTQPLLPTGSESTRSFKVGAINATMPHICVLTSAHPLDDVRVKTKIVDSFLALGCKVSWVGPDMSSFTSGSYRDPRIAYHLTKPIGSRVDRLLSVRRIARRAPIVENVDWYYSPDPDAAAAAVDLAKRSGAKVLFDIHEIFHEAHLDRWFGGHRVETVSAYVRRRISRTARRSQLVIGVSKSVLAPYIGTHTSHLIVRNCAPRWFADGQLSEVIQSADTTEPNDRSHGRTVFMHGKALPGNGTPVVLLAVSELAERKRDASVVMFTSVDGLVRSHMPHLSSQIEDLQIKETITLRSAIPHVEMPRVTEQCNVGMIAYGRGLGEGSLPNRMFEYMAGGCAILAPGYAREIKEIIDEDEIGRTADFDDPSDVADAMRWFIENPSETAEMGARARRAFLERHNWDTEFEQLVKAMDADV